MTELILTEKFSVASDFAKALGIAKKADGCFKNDNIIITWAVGHLVELYEPEDYDENLKKWRIETLPIIPEKFRYKPIKKTYQQFKIIKSLLKEKQIERVIIATDAGREGEVIARTILLESGFSDKDRIFRFWTSQALVPDVVRKTMNELKPLSHYDRLWRAGYYRQVADWLVGMNCTRMVTLRLHGDLFSVGRVQTAVLALVVDRKHERDRFVPETYWIIKVIFANDKGRWTGYWFRSGTASKAVETGNKQTENAAQKSEETQRSEAAQRSEATTRLGSLDQESGGNDSKSIQVLKKKEDVEATLQILRQASSGVVKSVKKEKKKEPPPFLFSLTDLQQEANRRFGFSAQKTLTIAQSLYQDKKCLSYPRTDSRVLGTQNLDMVQAIIDKLRGAYPGLLNGVDTAKISLSNKRVFNDSKLTDHHALIPFKPLLQDSSRDEQNIFNLVLTRFAASFYPDCQFENTHVVTVLANETFQTRGRVILVPGWRAVYQEHTQQRTEKPSEGKIRTSPDYSAPDSDQPEQKPHKPGDETVVELIPPLVSGDPAMPEKIAAEEKQTTPPPDYNDSLLLKDMINPGRYVEQEEIKKLYRGDVGIGTQATRAQIIETLIKRQYVERSGKKLMPTEKGIFLVDMLRKCPATSVLTSPEETARWEMSLNRIALGEITGNESGQTTGISFLADIKNFVASAVNELKLARLEVKNFTLDAPASAVIGNCPECGQPVRENRKGFSCSDRSCKFVIWKKIAGKIITAGMASNLMTFKKSGPFKGFVSREKKNFSASLVLHKQDGQWKVSFDFANGESAKGKSSVQLSPHQLSHPQLSEQTSSGNKPSVSAKPLCPLCGGHIIEGKKGYGCSNWRPEHGDCRFVIWKEIMGRKLTEKNIETLTAGKSTSFYVLKDQQGNKFKAKLKMVPLDKNIAGLQSSQAYAIEVTPQNICDLPSGQCHIMCIR
ncbi:MAG: topoisomerase C-terminal repeat-containing protein [Desulfamplus sp.]|nr:topoisomerase C-terminal repeat-containing protein [Desulfamplus sp.]